MAYFPNGSSGECFENQCARCKYGESPCPIAYVQMQFNYDACNNKVASIILNTLVHNDGTCMMFKCFSNDFKINERQTKLAI